MAPSGQNRALAVAMSGRPGQPSAAIHNLNFIQQMLDRIGNREVILNQVSLKYAVNK